MPAGYSGYGSGKYVPPKLVYHDPKEFADDLMNLKLKEFDLINEDRKEKEKAYATGIANRVKTTPNKSNSAAQREEPLINHFKEMIKGKSVAELSRENPTWATDFNESLGASKMMQQGKAHLDTWKSLKEREAKGEGPQILYTGNDTFGLNPNDTYKDEKGQIQQRPYTVSSYLQHIENGEEDFDTPMYSNSTGYNYGEAIKEAKKATEGFEGDVLHNGSYQLANAANSIGGWNQGDLNVLLKNTNQTGSNAGKVLSAITTQAQSILTDPERRHGMLAEWKHNPNVSKYETIPKYNKQTGRLEGIVPREENGKKVPLKSFDDFVYQTVRDGALGNINQSTSNDVGVSEVPGSKGSGDESGYVNWIQENGHNVRNSRTASNVDINQYLQERKPLLVKRITDKINSEGLYKVDEKQIGRFFDSKGLENIPKNIIEFDTNGKATTVPNPDYERAKYISDIMEKEKQLITPIEVHGGLNVYSHKAADAQLATLGVKEGGKPTLPLGTFLQKGNFEINGKKVTANTRDKDAGASMNYAVNATGMNIQPNTKGNQNGEVTVIVATKDGEKLKKSGIDKLNYGTLDEAIKNGEAIMVSQNGKTAVIFNNDPNTLYFPEGNVNLEYTITLPNASYYGGWTNINIGNRNLQEVARSEGENGLHNERTGTFTVNLPMTQGQEDIDAAIQRFSMTTKHPGK